MNLSTISKLSEDEARAMLERIRWPAGPVCAHCGATENVKKLEGKAHRPGLFKCNDCGEQFTATVNTIMEDTHLPIRIWMMAFSIICSAKKGISALQLQRQLGLGSYRSAWHLAHRIRHAMGKEPLAGLLKGTVTADETMIGGKPRKLAGVRPKGTSGNKRGRGSKKLAVAALIERDGRAIVKPVERVDAKTLGKFVRDHVDKAATLHTDEWAAYSTVGKEFAAHHVVNHGRREYARDGVSTNDAEAFFALLKRGVVGSFHTVSKQHLGRYCDEFAFRWNHRKITDGDRTIEAIKNAEGRRLMYREPVGKYE